MSVRIILADDHKIMREGLRALLAKQKEVEVIAEADSGRGVIELCSQLHPDVVVIDISMPDLNGIDAARQITRQAPDIKVIALSMHSDKKYVKEMLAAGASGYLLKDAAFEELGMAIATVLKNKTYLSPQITDTVVKDYVNENVPQNSIASTALSAREREVLQLISEGKNTQHIALALSLSEKTVAAHRSHIMHKLRVKSVAELTKIAVREGLTFVEL